MSFRLLAEGNWSGIEVEWKSVGAKHKIIKMAQMAKSWNGVDIIYEWSKYDAKSIRFASRLRVKTESNCTKIRYG